MAEPDSAASVVHAQGCVMDGHGGTDACRCPLPDFPNLDEALLASDATAGIASVACDEDTAQCSGCGEYRSVRWIGSPHACWRNENGSYEEGGTFQ